LKKKSYCQYKRSYFTPIISGSCLIGIEPSAILTLEMNTFAWLMIPLPLKSWQKLLDNRRIFQKEITAGKIRSNNFLRRSAK
jgi:hypothetical protein